jgi:hypothetical protein
MSVTNTIFGRWELPVADDVYIRNGSGERNVVTLGIVRYADRLIIWNCFVL